MNKYEIGERWGRREIRGVLETYDGVPPPTERQWSALNNSSIYISHIGMAGKEIGPALAYWTQYRRRCQQWCPTCQNRHTIAIAEKALVSILMELF